MTAQFLSLLIAFNPLDLTNDEILRYVLAFMVTRSGSGPEDRNPNTKVKRKERKK